MDSEKEEYEKQFQSWKGRRSKVEVPADFANKVMASVHGVRILRRWIWMQRVKAAFGRSRFLQTAVYLAAVALLILRLAVLFAIFVPLG
ncbi:MAG: hypothetical protein ACLP9L_00065 [Thermoguttaceae bacterium]